MKTLLNQALLVLLFSTVMACTPSAQSKGLKKLDAGAFAETLNACDHAFVLDVRTPEEFQTGYIHGAVNYNIYDADFDQRLGQIPKDKAVFVYCKGGGRSADAAENLVTLGFEEVYDLSGGVMSWTAKGNALEGQTAALPDQYTNEQFKDLIEHHETVLVDFYAPWCIPCRKMEPGLNAFAQEFAGRVEVVRIDIDRAKGLSEELGLTSVPIIITYKKGTLVHRIEGYQSDSAIRALIDEIMSK